MNCPYCHREEGEERSVSRALLGRMKDAEEIRFMGGEPTLYMDEIRKVVEAYPDAKFAITTNGKGFEKYRDFFLEHKFHVCFSFDGNDIRGFDPFTKTLDYPWVAVSCTLFHGNCDLKRILREFAGKEEVIGRSIGFFPHIAHRTSRENFSYGADEKEMEWLVEQYRACLERFVSDFKLGVVNMRWKPIMLQMLKRHRMGFAFGETYCVNHKQRKLDTSGQSYSCHYMRDEVVETQEQMAEMIRRKFPECEKCEVYDMCGAACVKSICHEIECFFYKRLCTWFKEFYKANEQVLLKIEEGVK